MARSSNGATIQLYVGDFAPLHALNFHPQFWCQHLKLLGLQILLLEVAADF